MERHAKVHVCSKRRKRFNFIKINSLRKLVIYKKKVVYLLNFTWCKLMRDMNILIYEEINP